MAVMTQDDDPRVAAASVEHAVGPTFRALRRRKDPRTTGFPVYLGLTDLLCADAPAGDGPRPNPVAAHVLATMSGYAYSDVDTVATMAARLGLESGHVLRVAQCVDAMFISSTCFVVQSADGRVVLVAYRGSAPSPSLSWFTDFDAQLENVRIDLTGHQDGGDGGMPAVHGGFYRNVRATRLTLVGALAHALAGRSVVDGAQLPHTAEALYLTGHSLGGAMAVLMGVLTVSEREFYADMAARLRGIYTFGQPMVGNRAFAHGAAALALPGGDDLGDRLFRYVYRRDVVPRLPPWAAGDFAHFGPEYAYGTDSWKRIARPRQPFVPLGEVALAVGDFLARQHRILRWIPFRYSLADHAPHHYVTALTPRGRPTEFGDYYLARDPAAAPGEESTLRP